MRIFFLYVIFSIGLFTWVPLNVGLSLLIMELADGAIWAFPLVFPIFFITTYPLMKLGSWLAENE